MYYLSKSSITDIISISLIIVSFYLPQPYYTPILYVGLFAISGAVEITPPL